MMPRGRVGTLPHGAGNCAILRSIVKTYKTPLSQSDLDEIAAAMLGGATAIIPTDTVYGIAAHPGSAAGVAKLFALKHRGPDKPLPLLAASHDAVAGCGLRLSHSERAAAEKFWPGPLTLIIGAGDWGLGTGAGGRGEGVRVPDSADARAICGAAGGLLRCTSANESGEPPALDAQSAARALPGADILVDGGPAAIGLASTVAKITANGVEILREGAVSKESLSNTIQRSIMQFAKILTAAEMRAERDALRQDGKKLVFTNGCFDIMHAGHVTYLKFAREQGDALCVGLNSDASVRGNKGGSRPIVDEANRAAVLAALRCVDYIVVFGEQEPKALIAEVLPDVLVKGRDWAHYVSGREIVEANGGSVVLADMVEGLSTTNIVNKILAVAAEDSAAAAAGK